MKSQSTQQRFVKCLIETDQGFSRFSWETVARLNETLAIRYDTVLLSITN